MRIDVPDTPEFWDRLESEFHAKAPATRRRRFGASMTAMRALRTFTTHAVHTAAVVGLAVVMVVSWSKPIGDTATVTINTQADLPGYVMQYAAAPMSQNPVERAVDNGYEVVVQRIFSTNPADDGRILDERHPGPLTVDKARGPLLFVIGYTIGTGDRTAN